MQSIAEWLEKLGLGQYAQCFAENGIDLSDLRHLTDQDLKDIGILLGHRRSDDCGGNNQGKVVRAGDPPIRRGNRTDVARA